MSMPYSFHKLVLCVTAMLLTPGVLLALPPDQIIHYAIHETPSDPESAVDFVISVKLHAEDVNGDEIGWSVERLVFRDRTSIPANDRRWVDNAPSLTTSDGLWWVEHANVQSPQRSEFTLPPALTGTATAADMAYADLNYDFVGETYTPPSTGAPYSPTASLTYTMTLVGEEDPEEDGEDEPVGVPEEDDPTTPA